VCYYSCESCYNVIKVARATALPYLNDILEGLCKLFAHVDVDIKNGASLLDRLAKDLVVDNSQDFEVYSLIPLIKKVSIMLHLNQLLTCVWQYITKRKPYTRQLMMTWFEVLGSMAETHLIDYLPEFLEGLFLILSDPNTGTLLLPASLPSSDRDVRVCIDIRQAGENLLADFLTEVRNTDVIDLLPLVLILLRLCNSRDTLIRQTTVLWIHSFIDCGGTKLISVYSGLLLELMRSVADVEVEISLAAQEATQALLHLVERTPSDIEYKPLITTLLSELNSQHIISKVTSLQWLLMLHRRNSLETNRYLPVLLPVLLRTLSDTNAEVVALTLGVMARVAADTRFFQELILSLTALFIGDRELLENRGDPVPPLANLAKTNMWL
jgi:vacuole morphology and inheritance protein 14